MKKIILLSFLSFQAMAGVFPKVETQIDDNKTIHVSVANESDNPIHCRWKVSWFDSLLSYKQFRGNLDVFPSSTEQLEFTNDPYSKVYKLKTNFKCL